MADVLPPPPPGATPPSPPSPASARPSRVRLWLALVVAVSALVGLVAVVVLALSPSGGGATVLFRDDFSEDADGSRWLEAADESGSMGPSAGSYRIAVRERGELQSIAELDGAESAVTVEMDGTMLSGTGGFSVLCVSELAGEPGAITSSPDRGVYYDFFVSFADDAYAILSSTDLRAPLAAGEADGRLRDGANRVVVRCAGGAPGRAAQLSLTLNGEEVLTYEDPDGPPSFRGVGLTVYSEDGPAEASFDDVVVSAA